MIFGTCLGRLKTLHKPPDGTCHPGLGQNNNTAHHVVYVDNPYSHDSRSKYLSYWDNEGILFPPKGYAGNDGLEQGIRCTEH